MKIEVTCNTEDDVLFRNIEQNSRRDLEWITEVPAHDEHAVIVGGGPSLIDSLDTIRWRQSLGQKIFALNGAANFLKNNSIFADYQVILDARSSNEKFISKYDSTEFLIASQCDESVFNKLDRLINYPNLAVKLWHPAIDGIELHLPDKRESLTLIGGGTTVGLSAMCLAYAMGYRKLHLFGYDSSHKESSHAYDQPMNAGEPICKVTVSGKTFRTSWSMAKQAEFFPTVCDNLVDKGCIITVDGEGLLPFMVRENAKAAAMPMTEQQKYEAMWGFDEYRAVAPGEHLAEKFVELTSISRLNTVIDFGCGTGRGAKKVHELTGCEFILIDFASNSLDTDIQKEEWFTLLQRDLTKPLSVIFEFGLCTDVLEHIPTSDVDVVIENIMAASDNVFFQISLVEDNCGALIGRPLHLTVKPFQWWVDKFCALGYEIAYQEDQGNSAIFYIKH